jgi:hypothetical protein
MGRCVGNPERVRWLQAWLYASCLLLVQALQTSLRQRDADRNDRLTAAASAASILHMQSQHVRGIAAASAAAHQERCTMDCTLQNGQYLAGQQRGADTLQGLGSPRGSSCSGRGSSNGGSGAPAGSCVSGEAALRLLLPSSGAGAASALAARGEVHPSCLPSKAAQAEVRAADGLDSIFRMCIPPVMAQHQSEICCAALVSLASLHQHRVMRSFVLQHRWMLSHSC